MLIEKVLCRAQVKATAGRDTRVVSSDGALDLKVSMPRELGGTHGRGTNPEQLFGAAYTSCFLGMLRLVAAREGIALPADAEIDASVAVGATPIEWASKDDPRVTGVGRLIRKLRFDELPQLVNVLKGEMSIVGPRPERPEFVEKFRQQIPGYMQKHLVKGGITGWAQVNDLRGDTDLNRRIEYDLFYIDNWSLMFDLRILCLTLWHILTSRNAH